MIVAALASANSIRNDLTGKIKTLVEQNVYSSAGQVSVLIYEAGRQNNAALVVESPDNDKIELTARGLIFLIWRHPLISLISKQR